jgi:adenylate cyclase
MGDCIMAFWNAPIDQENHRERAIEAAFNMQTALRELNEELGKYDQDEMAIGIGINTGECIVGNMGSEQRFDYTVLGDSVNLASRLEGQSNNYGFPMILGQSSVAGISSTRVIELDLISVKGKQDPERIYTVLGENIEIEDEEVFIDEHAKFVEMYRKQDWASAREHIEKYVKIVPTFDLYYELISNRIEEYIENPPPNDWKGVFVAKTK